MEFLTILSQKETNLKNPPFTVNRSPMHTRRLDTRKRCNEQEEGQCPFCHYPKTAQQFAKICQNAKRPSTPVITVETWPMMRSSRMSVKKMDQRGQLWVRNLRVQLGLGSSRVWQLCTYYYSGGGRGRGEGAGHIHLLVSI